MAQGFVSAAFGRARWRLAGGNRAGAVAVLDEVPDSSSQHLAAQIAAVRAGLDKASGTLAEMDLVTASMRLEKLKLDAQRRATLAIELFRTALEWLGGGGPPPLPAPPLAHGKGLGQALEERGIRVRLGRAYPA